MSGLTSRRNPTTRVDVNRTVFVDEKFGDDTTGIKERPDRPFATIEEAINVAVAGDTIYIRTGDYSPVANIDFPDGVNVHAENDVLITLTAGFLGLQGTHKFTGWASVTSTAAFPAVFVGGAGTVHLELMDITTGVGGKEGLLVNGSVTLNMTARSILANTAAMSIGNDSVTDIEVENDIDSLFQHTVIYRSLTSKKHKLKARKIICRDDVADAATRGACVYVQNGTSLFSQIEVDALLRSEADQALWDGEWGALTVHGEGQVLMFGDIYSVGVPCIATSHSINYRQVVCRDGMYVVEKQPAVLMAGTGSGTPNNAILLKDCIIIKNGAGAVGNDPLTISLDGTTAPNGFNGGKYLEMRDTSVFVTASFNGALPIINTTVGVGSTDEIITYSCNVYTADLGLTPFAFGANANANFYLENTIAIVNNQAGLVNTSNAFGFTHDTNLRPPVVYTTQF